MNVQLTWLNCFLLMVPVLIWNTIMINRLNAATPFGGEDRNQRLAWIEQGLRILVFVYPFIMPLGIETVAQNIALRMYVIGLLIYFFSWRMLILRPESKWSQSREGLLAPAWTTLIWFGSIALMGGSWLYAILALLFVVVHTLNTAVNLGFVGERS